MKATIENGKLAIYVSSLVDSLDETTRRELARHLVADAELFRAVLECVAKGEYFTDDDRGAWWFDRARVLELRTVLLPLMPEVARDAVREALNQRDRAKAGEEMYTRWAWTLYHAWPQRFLDLRPGGPPGWEPTPAVSDAEVSMLMAAHAAPEGR